MQKFIEFFEMTKTRTNIMEIWRSLQFFEIGVSLVPCFFGLHLVRLEAVEENRKLTVIGS